MADDLDQLLDEIQGTTSDNAGNRIKDGRSLKFEKTTKNRKLSRSLSEEIEGILDEVDGETPASALRQERGTKSASVYSRASKCSRPLLSGVDKENKSKRCDNLLCLSCDSPVVVLEGFTWREGTNYLFLRTNYPDVDKLKAQLEPSRPSRAYSCQCSHVSVRQLQELRDFEHLKWICRGHAA